MKTVRVPEGMAGSFVKAEELVSRYFRERTDDPERGTIEIFGERYVLVRAASLSVEFFSLVGDLYGPGREVESADFARNILFDLAHAIGKSDAKNFHGKMKTDDPIERLSAGPIHFAHAGWAFVDILPESNTSADEHFCMVYDHPYSFESDAWLRAGRKAAFPVCIMNAGYSSGWCQESFGLKLVSSEVLCRAKGDDHCRFIMATPERIEAAVERYVQHKPHLASRVRGYQIPDFFARKRTEEDLRRRFAEEMAERELVEKKLRQTHKLEAVGRLAGGIAHDFNNLMAIVMTRSAMLQRRVKSDASMRRELEQISEAAERAAALTQQLLAFSRAQVLRRELLDPNEIVENLGRLLQPLIGEDIEIELKLDRTVGLIEADRGQIEQVITNLLVNARDAMPTGGALVVETARIDFDAASTPPDVEPGRHVRLSVTDNGKGMDEETLSRIFEPFFTTKEDGKGTGLGLATAYGIIKQSGGSIAVSSRPGEGARFDVYLPRTEGEVSAALGRPWPATASGHETVLLVEDNDDVRAAVRDLLREEGYQVLDARDAADALRFAADGRTRIHLLLTDVVMPKMGGRALAARVTDLRPDVKIVFMSGYTPDMNLRQATNAEFIMKPFRPEQLVRKIRDALDR
jgi:two-component system cell cycle sensor histidine kinase/response regulator CckA